MSDETPTTESHGGDDDGRDERLAALLDVAPLDEVTRRRLVRNAVAAAPASRSWARLGVAASVAAVVVAALVAVGVALSDGSGDRPSAAPKATTGQDRERAAQTTTPGAPAPEAPSEDAGTPAPAATTTALPDVGDVSDAATLRDQVDALSSREAPGVPVVPCPELLGELGILDLVAVAQGADNGVRVLVLTGTEDGRPVAISVATDPCEVRRKALL